MFIFLLIILLENRGGNRAVLTEKQLEVIPEIFGSLVWGKSFLKSAEIRTPEKTP